MKRSVVYLVCLFALVVMAGMAIPSASASPVALPTPNPFPNMILNPGFEGRRTGNNFAYWDEADQDLCSIYAETSVRHSGLVSARIECDDPNGVPKLESNYVDLDYGPYTLTFWTRGDGTNAGIYKIANEGLLPAEVNGWHSTGVSGTSWQKVTVNFIAPLDFGGTWIDFTVAYDIEEFRTSYFDDVSLVAGGF